MEDSRTTGRPSVLGDYASLSDLVNACAKFYPDQAEMQTTETLVTRQHLSDWIQVPLRVRDSNIADRPSA
jgi:hypothetical protein